MNGSFSTVISQKFQVFFQQKMETNIFQSGDLELKCAIYLGHRLVSIGRVDSNRGHSFSFNATTFETLKNIVECIQQSVFDLENSCVKSSVKSIIKTIGQVMFVKNNHNNNIDVKLVEKYIILIIFQ